MPKTPIRGSSAPIARNAVESLPATSLMGMCPWSIGADVIFSSVGHGSAFDIAGQGIESPAALLGAIKLVSGRTMTQGGVK